MRKLLFAAIAALVVSLGSIATASIADAANGGDRSHNSAPTAYPLNVWDLGEG
ncbi:MAG TPA: hypothetical protein VMB73_29940 [Acetobacteraceae bacterium]|jgi:hypothetical protein|nr:hypothetical protein [Acetobacteraceae bacterium]